MDEKYSYTPIGKTDFRNQQTPFFIKDADRLRHLYVIGKTGVGKSTLLLNMAASDIQKGKGCCILDPHGDIAEKLLDYVPNERIRDVIYFNAADQEHLMPFNPLYKIKPALRHIATTNLVATFKRIFDLHNTPRLEYILKQCIITLLQYPNATLLHVQPLLTNKLFREEVLRHITDMNVKTFWYSEYDIYPPAFRIEAISSILNKINIFSINPILKNIVGQPGCINIKEILDSGKILVCNLSKGAIGEDTAALLGTLILSSIQQAVMQRVSLPELKRTPVYCYVDECHTMLNSASAAVSILSECRKFGLSLFLTHQYLDQLPKEIQSAVFGNVGTVISFQIGNSDAETLSKEFYPTFNASDFINLPKYAFYIKLMIDGVTSKGFSALSLPPSELLYENKEAIIALAKKNGTAIEIAIQNVPVIKEKPIQRTLFDAT